MYESQISPLSPQGSKIIIIKVAVWLTGLYTQMHNRGIELFASNVSVAHRLRKPSELIITLPLLNIRDSVACERVQGLMQARVKKQKKKITNVVSTLFTDLARHALFY